MPKYINLYKGSKAAKIWVSGYSRAGAVANALVYNPSLLGVNNDAIYAYTFEAPASLDSSNCNEDINVHNVLNSGDVIAAVVPSNYNIGRCGTVYPIYDEDAANIVKYEELTKMWGHKKEVLYGKVDVKFNDITKLA